jgi:hypothetical protein
MRHYSDIAFIVLNGNRPKSAIKIGLQPPPDFFGLMGVGNLVSQCLQRV